MAFVNSSLLFLGGLSVFVPILLHLLKRQKPKQQVFPALRFLKKRNAVNTRQLRLRQWILLALRCLALLLFAAVLARPSVSSASIGNWIVVAGLGILTLATLFIALISAAQGNSKTLPTIFGALCFLLAIGLFYSTGKALRAGSNVLLGDRQTPVAAVLVVDTSSRMLYRNNNKTRLEHSQEMAHWLIRQFPQDSKVAVIDTRHARGVFSVDLGAALKAVDALTISHRSLPIQNSLDEATRLLQGSDLTRKELYVFSDLSKKSWRTAPTTSQPANENILTYVIDVGIEEPQNTTLRSVELSSDTIAAGSAVDLDVLVHRTGLSSEVNATLFLENTGDQPPIIVDGIVKGIETVPRGQKSVVLDDDGSHEVRFKLENLSIGTHHGFIELASQDPLDLDNRRYFSVNVREPWSILIVKTDDIEQEFLTEQLAPLPFRETGRAKYDFTEIDQEQLDDQRLDDFVAVCLLDPHPMNATNWQRLERYVRRGGGLGVFAGRNAKSSFNSEAALSVLPAALIRQWKDPIGLSLSPSEYSHPILNRFREISSTVPWNAMPVYRHWVISDLQEASQVVLRFGNEKPAIVERVIGDGRVVLMTTPISDPRNRKDRPEWNALPFEWPFMVLMDQTMMHLVKSESNALNYDVGQTAHLKVENTETQARFQFFTPLHNWQEISSNHGRLSVQSTEAIGTYRVFDDKQNPAGGFSVNLDRDETQLDRIEEAVLGSVFGEENYQLARQKSDIVRQVDIGRIGREFYPFLLIMLAIALAMENLLANRFYRQSM